MVRLTGKQMRMARAYENVTQEYVASAMGISRTYYNLLENEKLEPSQDIMNKIYDLFEPTLKELNLLKESNFFTRTCNDMFRNPSTT